MEEKKIKKKKLTLTASPKKPLNVPRFSQNNQKKSVIIEKKLSDQDNFDTNKSIKLKSSGK